jgi:hypothetical protein
MIIQKIMQEDRAQEGHPASPVLDARAGFPEAGLAELYDPLTMKAHQANVRAVMAAYGFKKDMTEGEIAAKLMRRDREMTEA